MQQRSAASGRSSRARLGASLALLLFAAGPGCELPGAGPQASNAPTGVVCRAKAGKVNLSWTVAGGAYAYRIDRAAGGAPATPIGQAPGAAFADFSPPEGVPISYTVVALHQGAAEAPAAACEVTVATPGGPDPATDLQCRAGDGRVDLWWSPRAGVATWRLVRRANGAAAQTVFDGANTAVTDVALQNGVTHAYTVVAVDAQGRASVESGPCQAVPQAGIGATGPAPAPPTAFACRPKEVKADLTFTPSADTAYTRVYRSEGAGPEALVGTTAGGVFADFGLVPNATYRWTLEAVGPGGAISARSSVCVAKLTSRGTPPPTNLPPAFTSAPLTAALEDVYYLYDAVASDPEGGATVYSLAVAPPGMSIDETTGRIAWAPSRSQIGAHPVEVRATDPLGAYGSQAYVVDVDDLDEAPVFTSTPTYQARSGETWTYDADGFDPEGQPLAFAFAAPAPAGMTIDSATGLVSWTPTLQDVGTVPITLRVADPAGGFALQTFPLEATALPLDLVEPTGTFDIQPGQTLRLPLVANYRSAGFRLEGAPANATLKDGEFAFTPDASQEGDFALGFEAVLGSMRDMNPVTIRVRRSNTPPVLAAIGPQQVNEGGVLRVPVSATDADGDAVKLFAPGLALANAFFDEINRVLVFTPDFQQAGQYTVTLAASDARDSVQQTVDITVDDAPPPTTVTDLVLDPVPSPTFAAQQTISGSTVGQAQAGTTQTVPLVVGLAPSNVRQGRSVTVDVTGLHTQFASGAVTVDFGAGIGVQQVDVLSPTALRVTVSAALDAAVGVRAVTVTDAGGRASSVVAFSVEPGAAQLTGVLLDSFTGQPLAGARVGLQGAVGVQATTDAQGRFVLDGLPPGAQTVVVTSPNYAVKRLDLSVVPNEQVALDTGIAMDALARPFSAGGSLPAAASVASVIDRGATQPEPDLTLEQARVAVRDTLLAIGGQEFGIVDDAGRQLNPNMLGPGMLSLTPEGVDRVARRLVNGETYTLGELSFALVGALGWLYPDMSLERFRLRLELAAEAAWAQPNDPDNALALVLLNRGRTLDSAPPRVTADTRFNALQSFLFVSAVTIENFGSLNTALDELLVRMGLDPAQFLQQEGFPPEDIARADAGPGTAGADARRLLLASARALGDWIAGSPAHAAPSNGSPPSAKPKRTRTQAVAEAFVPSLKAGLVAGAVGMGFVLFFTILAAFVPAFGFLAATSFGGILLAFGISFASQALAKLAVAAFADPNAVTKLAPDSVGKIRTGAPAAGQDKLVIEFDRSDQDLQAFAAGASGATYEGLFNGNIFDTSAGRIQPQFLDYRYHLWKMPSPESTLSVGSGAKLVSTRTLPVRGKPNSLQFVLPASEAPEDTSYFRIVTIQFYRRLHNEDPDNAVSDRKRIEQNLTVFYKDLQLPVTTSEQEWKKVANDAYGNLKQTLFGVGPGYLADEVVALRDAIAARKAATQAMAVLTKDRLATYRAAQGLRQKFEVSASAETKAAEEQLLALEKRIADLRAQREALLKANQGAKVSAVRDLGFELDTMVRDPAKLGLTPQELIAELVDGPSPRAQRVRAALQKGGNRARLRFEHLADLAQQDQILGIGIRKANAGQAAIRQARQDLRLALNRAVQTVGPVDLPVTTIDVSTLGIDSAGLPRKIQAQFIQLPQQIRPSDIALVDQLLQQLDAAEFQLKLNVSSLEPRLQALDPLIEAAWKNVEDEFIDRITLRNLSAEIHLAEGEHKAVRLEQQQVQREFGDARRRFESIETSAKTALDEPKIDLDPRTRTAADIQAQALLDERPWSKTSLAKYSGEIFGFATDVGVAAWEVRDQLHVLRSVPSPLIVAKRVNGRFAVSQQASTTAGASGLAVQFARVIERGAALPEGALPDGALARVPALAFDAAGLALRAFGAIGDDGEPALGSARERAIHRLRREIARRSGAGARVAQFSGPDGFPLPFEPDPDPAYRLGILRPSEPQGPTGKDGFLVRDFPFSDATPQLIGAGFPSNHIAVDGSGAVYLLNANSELEFGGRIFKYQGNPIVRQHAGSVTYYSLDLQYARPVSGVAMEVGESWSPQYGLVEDVYVANLDLGGYFNSTIPLTNRVLKVPIHLGDRVPAYQNGQNRNRLVGQDFAAHPEFAMTGPSDLELDRLRRSPDPQAPRILYFSDEENLFALRDEDKDGAAEVQKVVSIAGRRWSGIAVDANGHLYFADFESGELFLLPSGELDTILLSGVPISTDIQLDQRAFLLKPGIVQPGDVELDTWGRRYLVATPLGLEAYNVPLVARLSADVAEVRADQAGREVGVTLRRDRGNIAIVDANSEAPAGREVRLRVRRVDPATGESTWIGTTVGTAPFGTTVLPGPL